MKHMRVRLTLMTLSFILLQNGLKAGLMDSVTGNGDEKKAIKKLKKKLVKIRTKYIFKNIKMSNAFKGTEDIVNSLGNEMAEIKAEFYTKFIDMLQELDGGHIRRLVLDNDDEAKEEYEQRQEKIADEKRLLQKLRKQLEGEETDDKKDRQLIKQTGIEKPKIEVNPQSSVDELIKTKNVIEEKLKAIQDKLNNNKLI